MSDRDAIKLLDQIIDAIDEMSSIWDQAIEELPEEQELAA